MSGHNTPSLSVSDPNLRNSARSTVSRFVSSPELMEQVFLYLSYAELLRTQRVCKLWESIQNSSVKVQQLLWKAPKFIEEGQDPHFPVKPGPRWLNPMGQDYINTQSKFFELVFEEVENYQQSGGTGVYHYDLQFATTHLSRTSSETLNNASFDISEDVFSYRRRYVYPRPPITPDPIFMSLYCKTCHVLHNQLEYSHLHPLLQFFKDNKDTEVERDRGKSYACMQGVGSKIVMATIVPEWDFESTHPSVLQFCRNLKRAHEIIEQSGLHDDLLMQPVATRLILLNNHKHTRALRGCRGYNGPYWAYDLRPPELPNETEVYVKDQMIIASEGIRLRHIMPLLLSRYHRVFVGEKWYELERYLQATTEPRVLRWTNIERRIPLWPCHLNWKTAEIKRYRNETIEVFEFVDELEDMMGDLWFPADEDGNRLDPAQYKLVKHKREIIKLTLYKALKRAGLQIDK